MQMSRFGYTMHEFDEDPDDYSMCVCGVPADVHTDVEIRRQS